METPPEIVPRTYIHPRLLTILGTYKCTAICKHCCVDSNPWLTQRVSLHDIVSFIEEGSRYPSVCAVVFSGGETFLLGDDLVRAVDFATKKGLKTRCVTNGYWAKSLIRGRKRLRELKDAGLCELNLSTGDYHQEWVSEDSIVNAACLGVELEMESVVITVELQTERRVTAAHLLENSHLRALWHNLPRERFQIIESPWMPMDARQISDQPADFLLTRQNAHLRHGCKSIFTTTVMTPAKRIGVCCGLSRELIPELNCESTGRPLSSLLEEAGNDFMKIWLFVDGPERILAWAGSKNPQIEWEGRYAHYCHACLALFQDPMVRRTIAEHYRERVEDVLMRYSVLLRRQELLQGAVYN
jgi:hypothetical protein